MHKAQPMALQTSVSIELIPRISVRFWQRKSRKMTKIWRHFQSSFDRREQRARAADKIRNNAALDVLCARRAAFFGTARDAWHPSSNNPGASLTRDDAWKTPQDLIENLSSVRNYAITATLRSHPKTLGRLSPGFSEILLREITLVQRPMCPAVWSIVGLLQFPRSFNSIYFFSV